MTKNIGTTKCKVCGDPHRIDSYREMKFYVCPRTNRVYLVAAEKNNEPTARDMEKPR